MGGGLRASALVSDVSRVVDGRRDPGDATSFHFAYTLDCQAYLKPTGGSRWGWADGAWGWDSGGQRCGV